ncbi:AraC family transcriptional regulator [Acinetobacter sp. ANC 4558]|uniref:AraC family transcriptional regulator n=1 Tax=Acinetobacter sp. ANC 4558 TaxID=1977876 RepID=UPI000A35A8C0|nr:helix-turn-helix transcriptional regulator [Acinetobacter sp. ANC 4558]OTG86126.1 AraC family transcriptional regulator [Acinetobacter sp. ANC 4558]
MTNHTALSCSVLDFNPDQFEQPAIALKINVQDNNVEQPVHQHEKGQLLIAMTGGVVCKVTDAVWIAPPQHAIWIPSQMFHSNRATDNAQLYFLFIDENVIDLPKKCCTLAISPLLRELIQYLAKQDQRYECNTPISRLVNVLLEQLTIAPIQALSLPMSEHPKIRYIADELTQDPSNRFTLRQWATFLAMTERTLARLIKHETGLTFGRWRQQLHILIALNQLSTGLNVQQVAGNLGYDSVTAFITMFKKSLGCTPTQYFAKLH